MTITRILASAALTLASCGAQAAVLTFDQLSDVYGYGVPGPNMTLTDHSLSYTEGGYTMTLWAPNALPGKVHIGDAFFGPFFNWHATGENGPGSYVTLTRNGGGAFDLSAFEFGDFSTGFTVHADGYADRYLIDTATLAVDYRSVTEVRFFGVDNFTRLDNIVVTDAGPGTEVPEPSSALLVLAGLGLAGAMRRRRKPA